MKAFGVPAVVAINRVAGDTDREVELLVELAREHGADEVAVSKAFERGGSGAEDLAKAVLSAVERPAEFRPLNRPGTPVREQIERIATRLYGADRVELSPAAERSLGALEERGLADLPVCMAKSHMSLSRDPRPQGPPPRLRPSSARPGGVGGCRVRSGPVRRRAAHSGTGEEPAYKRIDVAEDGRIVGLS